LNNGLVAPQVLQMPVVFFLSKVVGMVKVNIFLLAVVALFMIACGTKTVETVSTDRKADVGSVSIHNGTDFDVVIFAGRVSYGNVWGEIQAGQSRAFDLNALPLPERSGSFLVHAVSNQSYTKRQKLITPNDILYTALVVYNLNDPNDRTIINIFDKIQESQREYIYANNNSPFILELRLDIPNGEKIATLPPFASNTKIYLTPLSDGMPYTIYPSYVYVDPESNEIKRFLSASETDRYKAIPMSDGYYPLGFNGPSDTSNIQYNYAFLRIRNNTNEGLSFKYGEMMLADQKGRRHIASGELQTFELSSLSGDLGQIYSNLNVEFDNTKNSFPIKPSISVKSGVVYELVVSEQNGAYGWEIKEVGFKERVEDMTMSLLFE
jgi:hypothetical protein